jgi:hypothetical protein
MLRFGIAGVIVVSMCARASSWLGKVLLLLRGAGNDGVQPLADRHPGTARGLLRGFPRLLPHAFHVPRNARFHARIRMFGIRANRPLAEPTLVNRW